MYSFLVLLIPRYKPTLLFIKLAQKDAGNLKDLEKKMENKVKEWLDYT